jgi:hypothetical protein
MIKGKEWLNQRLDPLNFGFAQLSSTEGLGYWPVGFYQWDISSEVQNCSCEFVNNQGKYPRVNICKPTMHGNEGESSYIVIQLLSILGEVLIAPLFQVSPEYVVHNLSLSGNSLSVPSVTELFQ